MTRLTIRIDFDEGDSFGPGKAKLLELIGELASLRRAAATMEMSYRQAWLLVQAAGESFGAPLVETAVGGACGGGSRLTALGAEVLARYRAIEAKAASVADPDVAALTKLSAAKNAAARRKFKRRKKS